ncbi:MAG: helix-turn-helix transcriptional regulator [Opitutales bacterium]|nr:helix-turn-helix transcriptional regulator [Opitutales bacterium]MCH8540268.1 helix-turn-helix domain-containing protein [Opitutales bacterium]
MKTNDSVLSEPSSKFDFLQMRKRYRLTQAELADMVKVSKNYICQIETGRKEPSQSLIELAQRIERELSVNPPLKLPTSGRSSTVIGENPAIEYLRKVWRAAEGDRDLEGYITTQLKLTFPLDKRPFVDFPHEEGDFE